MMNWNFGCATPAFSREQDVLAMCFYQPHHTMSFVHLIKICKTRFAILNLARSNKKSNSRQFHTV